MYVQLPGANAPVYKDYAPSGAKKYFLNDVSPNLYIRPFKIDEQALFPSSSL